MRNRTTFPSKLKKKSFYFFKLYECGTSCLDYKKKKEKWCSWSSLSLPHYTFCTISIPIQSQPQILHSKSSRTKTHHMLAHLTTLICLEHQSRWVTQLPCAPSVPVRTQDLWKEAPAPSQLRGSHLGELRQQQWECERRAEIILWSTDSTEIPASQWAC